MDADVERLVRENRLIAAAELASERGDHPNASELYERACEFSKAAEEASRGGDFHRALLLVRGRGPEALVAQAIGALVSDPKAAERTAEALIARGDPATAARLFDAANVAEKAARAYEKAGDAVKAAERFETANDVVSAGRALEAALRKTPDRAELLLALGGLLLRYGKIEQAVRALQKVGADAPERRSALTLLVGAAERLGWTDARTTAERELAALGGPRSAPAPSMQARDVRSRVFGRYEVVREIASSPNARVLECRDDVNHERVALKVFSGHDDRGRGRDALARFEREVRVLGALEHPNIVPLRTYLPEGPALVMAWMGGGTLAERLTREVPSPRRAVEIADAVLLALAEAHRLGILHRDVKPANVLFDDAGVTRLADFGVAHLGDLSTTATAGVIGTLGYMSPEQREGRPASVRSDVFGVGVMLLEMLTGEPPDPRRTSTETRLLPSAVHRELDARHDAIVLAMIAEAPENRPEDALSARRQLQALAWPDTVERALLQRAERHATDPTELARLTSLANERGDDGLWLDRWMNRRIERWPLDDDTLRRASSFAQIDHPTLQTVLRVDRETNTIWLEAPRGARWTSALSAAQASTVREALERLHASGHVHGQVDEHHLFTDDRGSVTLRLSLRAPLDATPETDLRALSRLVLR